MSDRIDLRRPFFSRTLLTGAADALLDLAAATSDLAIISVIGLPLADGGRLYNVAAVLHKGKIMGFVPKFYLQGRVESGKLAAFLPARPCLKCPLPIKTFLLAAICFLAVRSSRTYSWRLRSAMICGLPVRRPSTMPPPAQPSSQTRPLVANLSAGPPADVCWCKASPPV